MYTLLLDGNIGSDLEKLGFMLGGYGQLMDDIFDLYDDAKDGVQTFANQAHAVYEIRAVIQKQEKEILDLAKTIALNPTDYQRFMDVLNLFGGIIELAIRQFEKIEKTQGLGPSLCLSIPRKNWIIDMEKPVNVLRLFRVAAQKLQQNHQ